eukprot:gene52430-16613_t
MEERVGARLATADSVQMLLELRDLNRSTTQQATHLTARDAGRLFAG